MIPPTHKFIVLDVQQDKFGPEVSFLSSPDNLGDINPSDEELQVFHHWRRISSTNWKVKQLQSRTSLWLVLAVEN